MKKDNPFLHPSRILVFLSLLGAAPNMFAGTVPPSGSDLPAEAPSGSVTAFVSVNVIPMDRDGVMAGQTVVVRGDRIAEIGPSASIQVPDGAEVIDGTGKYLLPGLTDAHMHLDAYIGARPDFGDAPLFLAYGITTVFNLRGEPAHLDWKRRVLAGKLPGPNLYNSGEFLNEPRVNTPDEVDREVVAQKQAGYDMIKYHQVLDEKTGRFATTTWLGPEAFQRMNDAARREGIPLLGHGPYNLGLQAALDAHESISHMGEFNPLYFFPVAGTSTWAKPALGGLAVIILSGLWWLAARLVRRLRGLPAPSGSVALSRVGRMNAWLTGAALAGSVCWILLFPGGPFPGSIPLLLVLSAIGLLCAAIAVAIAASTVSAWKQMTDTRLAKTHVGIVSIAALAFAVSLAHWIPISWRCTDSGIERVARDCKQAGIWVQSTLVIYDTIIEASTGGADPTKDPAFKYLPAEVRKEWTTGGPPVPPMMAALFRRYPEFTRKVTAALHKEGVPIMAGTDALGAGLIIPGTSFHRELELLTMSGFTPREALWSATVGPAKFLGKENEFGTITPGRRADMILVERNPLENLACLRQPVGVMVRGCWLSRQKLDSMLAPLATR
jgi:hypothetical protein